MQMRTQAYATAAINKINARQAAPGAKEYGQLALNFPVMVLQSGLVQAVGFLQAKGKAHHTAYLDDVADMLGFPNRATWHEVIVKADLAQYMQLTRTTLDAAGWLKRYAQGVMKAENGGNRVGATT